MSLRSQVRNTLTRGAQVLAAVEGYASGYASVRVAGTGSRLTNLPCTEAVRPGQTVMVDYSAEGRPIVRPWTLAPEVVTPSPLQVVTASERLDPLEDPKLTWEEDEFVSVRVTKTSSWIMPLDWYNPLEPMEPYLASNPVRFNTTLWDTHGMLISSGNFMGGFTMRLGGHYFVRLTVAFPESYAGLEVRASIYAFGLACGWTARHTRWNQYGPLIVTVTSLVSAPAGSSILPVARARDPRLARDINQPFVTMPADPGGAYPIFEAALIAPLDPGNPKAVPWWWNV